MDITKVERRILADKPRITRYDIEWEKSPQSLPDNSNSDDKDTLISSQIHMKENENSEENKTESLTEHSEKQSNN